METLGYILIYFLRGGVLPWMNLKVHKEEDKYNKIKEIKTNITVQELCIGFPKEFE